MYIHNLEMIDDAYVVRCTIRYQLYNLKFEKFEKHPWGSVTLHLWRSVTLHPLRSVTFSKVATLSLQLYQMQHPSFGVFHVF